jgi:hypothetical protein
VVCQEERPLHQGGPRRAKKRLAERQGKELRDLPHQAGYSEDLHTRGWCTVVLLPPGRSAWVCVLGLNWEFPVVCASNGNPEV